MEGDGSLLEKAKALRMELREESKEDLKLLRLVRAACEPGREGVEVRSEGSLENLKKIQRGEGERDRLREQRADCCLCLRI
jgi:hypothetical protein